ncbi:hypothetical protein DV702_00025 [Sporosarcina sp. PTS2304]|nr:hypothetical protein DV702_00025 [Sporosarcina sp. PTS2304]
MYVAGILAAYALLGLFLLVPVLVVALAGNLLLLVLAILLVIVIVLFALAIIVKGLSRLLHHWKRC